MDQLLSAGPRQAATSERRDPIVPYVEEPTNRLKKMKSTLPDVGKLKSEYKKENELLR